MRAFTVGFGWFVWMVGMRMIYADDDLSHLFGFVVCCDDVSWSDIISPNALGLRLPRVGNGMQRHNAGLVPLRPKKEANPFFRVGFLKVAVDFVEQFLWN